ncbi:RUB1 [Symbiodinium natans]|uniref:RUB1 protein n=1 Tax=Symbiodinium natans TaxID=878477 RepID=A0A812NAQ6_9DINO|nr:RUB1 [Symbiodinium natans]
MQGAQTAYRWALGLIAKITARVVHQGSTIVMKAINTNEKLALKKAISVSPRVERAKQLLEITVGTQSISPLYWAIESGSLLCAEAMIEDLMTIRADRDVYYFGFDALFTRHRDVINKLCMSAPFLLNTLLDGLVWRSRLTSRGLRRVNYYVKYLVQELDGSPSQALQWLVEYNDPKVIRHDAVSLVSDVMWARFAQYRFIAGRLYLLVAVLLFVTSQSILFRRDGKDSLEENVVVLLCRALIYTLSLGALLKNHLKSLAADCSQKDFVRVCGLPLPQYLCHPRELSSMALVCVLLTMLSLEPIIWCGLFSIDKAPAVNDGTEVGREMQIGIVVEVGEAICLAGPMGEGCEEEALRAATTALTSLAAWLSALAEELALEELADQEEVEA